MIMLCTLYIYCRYEDSAQDKMEGVVKMHRRVTSEDVEDYSSHIPGDDVALDREEDIVYKEGVLTHSEGVSTVKMMPQVNNQTSSILVAVLSDQFVMCNRMTAPTQTMWKETLWRQN